MPLNLESFHESQKSHILPSLVGFRPGDLARVRIPIQVRSMYPNPCPQLWDPVNLEFESIVESALHSSTPSYAFDKKLLYAGTICLITDMKVAIQQHHQALPSHKSLYETKGPFYVFAWMTLMVDGHEWVYWTRQRLDYVFRDQTKLWKKNNGLRPSSGN